MKKKKTEEGFLVLFKLELKMETWFKLEVFETLREVKEFEKTNKLKIIKSFYSTKAHTLRGVYSSIFGKNFFKAKEDIWFLMTKKDLKWFLSVDESNLRCETERIFSVLRKDYRKNI